MVRIEDATTRDAQAIAEVHVAAWQAGYRGLLPEKLLAGLSVSDSARRMSELIEEPQRCCVLLARDGAQVAGFACAGACRDDDATPDLGELYAIYVTPGRWRGGVGGALHEAALRRLRAWRFTAATLWVLVGNERAMAFYRRAGWAEDGARKVETGSHGVSLAEQRMRILLHQDQDQQD